MYLEYEPLHHVRVAQWQDTHRYLHLLRGFLLPQQRRYMYIPTWKEDPPSQPTALPPPPYPYPLELSLTPIGNSSR